MEQKNNFYLNRNFNNESKDINNNNMKKNNFNQDEIN